jgi:hypothetical protein
MQHYKVLLSGTRQRNNLKSYALTGRYFATSRCRKSRIVSDMLATDECSELPSSFMRSSCDVEPSV